MDDIFLKIIHREIPSNILYADDLCIAFYDKFPIRKGHFLVVPKNKSKNILETSEEETIHLIKIAKKLAKEEIIDKFPGSGFKLIINTNEPAGQTVFHTHIHIIPYKQKLQKKA